MKIQAVLARKGDTPEYISRMQPELFDVLSKAKGRKELREVESSAKKFWRSTL
jgi:hypothetical protein